MSERDLAAMMWQASVRGGVVHVPAGTYSVFALNVWTLRYERRARGVYERQPAIRARRGTAAIAHRMKSFAGLTGPLLIPRGIQLRGANRGD